MGLIYKATFSNGKSYIGFTTKTLDVRIQGHKTSALYGKSNYIFHKAIRKYGFDDISWSVICYNDILNELKELEKEYIIREKSHYTENGYNLTLGGDGGDNRFWYNNLTPEEREEYDEIQRQNGLRLIYHPNRLKSLKTCWNGDDKRKKAASDRLKEQRKDKNKEVIRNQKNSLSKRQAWKDGVYQYSQMTNMTEKAREVVKGSYWYNDGIRNYRLKSDDDKIKTSFLNRGKIKIDKR